ncbi:D,D-heptose 1,7-bisphosphate phosphatase GmhB [Helicobacter bizzozeronii]|nr:D,D-heptose 1,7-bisphosphate phosphatase GmhB [Helicobacter bizzozeronii]
MGQRALFLDRDGVINVNKGYVSHPLDFELIPGILDVCKRAKDLGYLLIVVTNQSGIARGYYTPQDFLALNAYMQALLRAYGGVSLDAIYHCPHLPGARCACRKPNLGMLQEAQRDFEIDLDKSIMLGDQWSDMQFGLGGGFGINLWLKPSSCFLPHRRLFKVNHLQQVLEFLKL